MKRILSFLATAAAAFAEVHTLTLKQVVQRALAQNPDILLARFDEVKAEHQIREAQDPFHPKVIVGSGLAYTSGFPMSIEGSAPSVIRADAIQTLFNREKSLQVAKAKEQARGAAIDTQAKREEVILRTANAYLDVDRLRRNSEIAAVQVDSLKRMLDTTRVRAAEGRELEVDSKKAAARHAQAQYTAGVLSADVSIAQENLAGLLGFPAGDSVRPADQEQLMLDVPADEQEVIENAMTSSKELKSLESKLQAAGLEIKSNQAARLPKVDLVAQYGLFARFNNYDQFFQKFQRNNGQVGVSFQLPLLAGSASKAREQQAEADSARLRLELNSVRNRVRMDARRAYQDLKAAESLQEVSRLDLEAAREQVSVTTNQFSEGRAGLRQVEEARVAEQEKWMSYLNSRQNVERRKLAILRVSGTLIATLQ